LVREEQRLRVCEYRVLRIVGPRREENGRMINNCMPCIIRDMKSKKK
jgi:hypothetical protein